jgi:acetylornithine deacetylase/succinyl-diaminopimelate desuccinylase-like protein
MGLITELKTLEAIYAKRPSAYQTGNKVTACPTLMIGGICGGGSKINTIPDRFSFTVDRRISPEEKLREIKAEILGVIGKARRKDKQLKVEVEYPLYVDPAATAPEELICQVARKAIRTVINKRPRLRMASGFLDMHFLTRDARIPTVAYGVDGRGAHDDGEFITISSLLDTAKIYTQIIRNLPRD